MNVKEGMVYHIKDEYFDLVQGCDIKCKSYAGHTYPAYCCFIDKACSTIWMIPMSTKIDKYKAVYDREIEKYGHCMSIVFGIYDKKLVAFQIQNMMPITKKYVLHPHTRNGKPISVEHPVRNEIRSRFDNLRELYQKGVPCLLSDIKRAEHLIHNNPPVMQI